MTQVEISAAPGSAEAAPAARSHVYKLLAHAFAFPTPALADAVASGALLAELSLVREHLPFALPLTKEDAQALGDPDVRYGQMQRAYIGLFDVGQGQPFCPLYEGSHREGRMKLMEDTVRFFEHFGLKPAPGDQPDHLCAELEFMHFLAFKQAAAAGSGRRTEGLGPAQRDFLARHLCRWLPKVQALLESQDDISAFYRALARFGRGFCDSDLGWLKRCREKSDGEIGPLPD